MLLHEVGVMEWLVSGTFQWALEQCFCLAFEVMVHFFRIKVRFFAGLAREFHLVQVFLQDAVQTLGRFCEKIYFAVRATIV